MSKILYHGTTETGLKHILSGVSKPFLLSPWKPSAFDQMYFIDLDQPEGYESWDILDDRAIKYAFSCAKLQSCMNEDVDLYVIECCIPESLCSADSSTCSNSAHVQVPVDDFNLGFIRRVYHIEINPYCKPEYLMGMWENGSCNRDAIPKHLREYVEGVNMKTSERTPHHLCARELIDFNVWNDVSKKYV